MRWNAEKDVAGLIAAQFNSGVLRPRDVPEFKGAGDALAHGFFAWAKRQYAAAWTAWALTSCCATCRRCWTSSSIRRTAASSIRPRPLYLGIEITEESIFEIGRRAAELRNVHPRLVSTAMVLINRAAGRTMWVRTPDEFLGEFASWYWDGDSNATDEEAREMLTDRFGDDEAEIEHTSLPLYVRSFVPTTWTSAAGTRRADAICLNVRLASRHLRRLQRFTSGRTRRICAELESSR